MGIAMPRLMLPLLVAVAAAALLAAGGLRELEWTDYEREALPAVTALVAGDHAGFLAHAPAYGGSLLLRAPFALGADAAGGGPVAVWRALAAPALLASIGLGLVLWSGLARAGRRRAAWGALLLAILHPTALRALTTGHPEEVVGAVLCVGAVAAAIGGRPVLSGVVLGAAGANKPWAVVAALPVLVALHRGHVRCTLAAGVTCAAVLAPFLLTGSAAVASAQAVATAPPDIFQPMQPLWFLGGTELAAGGIGAERSAPAWIGRLSHPAVVLAGFAVALAWLPRRRRGQGAPGDALLLLALVLLTRCALDIWTVTHYFAPFALALLTWEAAVRRRAPVGSAAVAGAIWLAEVQLTADAQAAFTLAWLPLAWGLIALRLWAPARSADLASAAAVLARARMPSLTRVLRPTA